METQTEKEHKTGPTLDLDQLWIGPTLERPDGDEMENRLMLVLRSTKPTGMEIS